MGVLIDGKKLAEKLCEEVKSEAAAMSRRPCLAAVLVGDDPASQIYVRNKERDCLKCGIDSRRYDLAATTTALTASSCSFRCRSRYPSAR